MNSFLIIAKNPKIREASAMEMVNRQHINHFDITTIDPQGSIGIEIIRTIQKTIFLTPVKGKKKAVIIKNADAMTFEAQNAFLKILEEPPLHLCIILTAENQQNFLPTVLSRCSITYFTESRTLSTENKQQYTAMLTQLYSYRIGEKLYLAQNAAKDKETALLWLEQIMLTAHQHMLEAKSGKDRYAYSLLITKLQQTYTTVKKTNVNPRFALEHLFLSLD